MEPGPSEGNCQPASPVVPSTPKAAPTLGTTPSPIGQPLAEVSQSPPLMGYPMQAGNVCYYPYKHSIHPPLPYMPGFGAHTAHAIPPGFMAYTTHPILAVEKQKTQSGVQGVYPGLFFNVPGHMINAVSPSHALNIVVPLSTTNGPGHLTGSRCGITHYSNFQTFKVSELKEAGIKKGHARTLIASLARFECHLKTS
ncbi:uncharacterized protein VP01_2629g1 [Puccinia sorghi]|uniref:Uncharacterized protein n=1 Tax=Puccinia sorghi TaxID=27349 RepID=A0A0L6V4C9_9BASI|nr:uncharacterized protein VP01_2629g1 [Puccinia sorghi]